MSSVQATNRQICFSSQSATSKALDIQIVQRLNWIVAVLLINAVPWYEKLCFRIIWGANSRLYNRTKRRSKTLIYTITQFLNASTVVQNDKNMFSCFALLLTMSYKSGERVPLHCHMFITAHFHFLSQYKRLETSIKPTYPSQTHFVTFHNETTTVCFFK